MVRWQSVDSVGSLLSKYLLTFRSLYSQFAGFGSPPPDDPEDGSITNADGTEVGKFPRMLRICCGFLSISQWIRS